MTRILSVLLLTLLLFGCAPAADTHEPIPATANEATLTCTPEPTYQLCELIATTGRFEQAVVFLGAQGGTLTTNSQYCGLSEEFIRCEIRDVRGFSFAVTGTGLDLDVRFTLAGNPQRYYLFLEVE